MSIRLVVTITAAPGKGAEAMKEPGCEQFEVFQGVASSDRLTLLERWVDQAALDGAGEREDYEYNRTR